MKKTYTVVAQLVAREGKAFALKAALSKVVLLSRKEDSCLVYRLYQDREHPGKFGLFEVWKNKELYKEQLQKPYILELIKLNKELIEKPYSVVFGDELVPVGDSE